MSGVDDTYTKSLLHCNGSDASTTFTDESGKTWTAYGNAQIDTAQSKFGGASGLFDGSGDYIQTPGHVDFNVKSENFTIDMWIRRANTSNDEFVFIDATTYQAMYISVGRTGIDTWNFSYRLTSESTSTVHSVTSSGPISADGNFHHIAVVRMTSTIYLFQDGVQVGSGSIGSSIIRDTTNIQLSSSTSSSFNGWIDEFRFSKGIARWNGAFTPPTSAYDYVTPSTEFIQKVNMF